MDALVDRVAGVLLARQLRLVTAESCTGGLVAAHLTSIPGSSDWFEGGFVSYRLSAKVRMLGVSPVDLERYTAVSEPVARQMAIGALNHTDAGVSIAITGVAGPGGGDLVTPVGTVWFAWGLADPATTVVQASQHRFTGDREQVREQAVEIALRGLLELLE